MTLCFLPLVEPIALPLKGPKGDKLENTSITQSFSYRCITFQKLLNYGGIASDRLERKLSFLLCFATPAVAASCSGNFVVISFYLFVFLRDPEAEVAKHLSFLKDLNIHGRIYISEQGINAQYSGPLDDALAYSEFIKKDPRFSNVLVQISPAINGHAFPRLRLRYKPSLVQLEGGISHLPLLDSSLRAKQLAPSEWRKRLEGSSQCSTDQLNIILDVRNGYEWDIGHFHGAQRPEVDCFRNTSFGLSGNELTPVDPLAIADKEKTNIYMYCTGGIRCDVYSTILRQQGFKNLYTLKGGVSHYLESEGPERWIGNLFVFDDRLSLPPVAYKPETSAAMATNDCTFARCYSCGYVVSELRHRNCANLDCNHLFLCCLKCVEDLRGCCSRKCTTASRIRPALPGNQRYGKWYTYKNHNLLADRSFAGSIPESGPARAQE